MSDTPLRLVLFDFDGTLCDSAATIIRLMKQACAVCGSACSRRQLYPRQYWSWCLACSVGLCRWRPEKASQLAETYRHISRNEYLGGQPPLDPLFDGAEDILCALQSKDYLTGIITNKSRSWPR